MRLELIDENKYKEYLKDKSYKFLQSYEQVIYSKKNGRTYLLLGMFDEKGTLVRAAFILTARYARFFKKAYLNMYEFSNREIDERFLKGASDFLKKQGFSIFYLTTSQSINVRDEEANIIKVTEGQKEIDTQLKKLGFVESEFDDVTSYAYQYVKDIDNIKTEDELLSSYKTKDRNKIRKSFKNGLCVEKATRSELEIFREVFNKSAVRQGFYEQPLKYFESYYDAYKESGKVDFLICYLDGKKYFETREKELDKLKANLPKAKNIEEEERKIKALQEKMSAIEDIKEKKVPISCGVFVESKDEYVYFLGGNDLDYTKYLGAYFVQHNAMLTAINKGLKTYNFFGTVGAYIKGEQEGVYTFKRRFNGYPKQLGNYKKVLSGKHRLAKALNRLTGK